MTEFLGAGDAFVWALGTDPRLRAPIVTVTMLDRSPDFDVVLDQFDRLSLTVPRLRSRIAPSPPPMPPRWQTDPDFDLRFHVRRLAAPTPATLDTAVEFARLAAMADFDHAHPLWEATVLEGLPEGGAALICQLHHSITDGVGAVAVAAALFGPDTDTAHSRQSAHAQRESVAQRSAVDLLVREAVSALAGTTKLAFDGAVHPAHTARSVLATGSSLLRSARPSSGPHSPTMQCRSSARHLAMLDVPRAPLQRAGHIAGGSLNDAFLAAVAHGVRLYHRVHDVVSEELLLTMPISVRKPGDPPGGNRTMLLRFELPLAITDPAERIQVIHLRTDAARHEKSLRHTNLVATALRVAPRSYVSSALRRVDLIASDVPGLPAPVAFAGARVRAQYAFSPTLGAAFNITLLSYADTCALGLNADCAAIPDLTQFRDCIAAGFDDVLALGR